MSGAPPLRLPGETLQSLAARWGGRIVRGREHAPRALAPVERAAEGDLAPVLAPRFLGAAREAAERGAALLVGAGIADRVVTSGPLWVHDCASWAMADLLDGVKVEDSPATQGRDCRIAASAVLGPRVTLGDRVSIGAGAVVGHPGFGWAFGPHSTVRPIPQLGGVVLEDDVSIGPLCTIDAGTLGPTRIERGTKIDAQVHVGHNVHIGEGTFIAAQCGLAGSVRIGRGVLLGGQVGVADHVVIGDGARIAAKSGVIGDVPRGAVMAGYPARPRARWLRALATLYGRADRA